MGETGILLRPWEMEDKLSLVKYANNKKIADNLRNLFPYPFEEKNADHFISLWTSMQPVRVFAIELDGEAIGAIGLHAKEDVHEKNMELGYWLAEPFWGKGIATRAVGMMVNYGFKTWPILRIYAGAFGSNIASQKVLEKCGFFREGILKNSIWKNERIDDEIIYAIYRD
ncbi:MAG: GNAT family N-acetyltransferase [Bacteroidetes bacterium]|nr:GNAT family N-acetyltransferase [Bacteroidota bacterium]